MTPPSGLIAELSALRTMAM